MAPPFHSRCVPFQPWFEVRDLAVVALGGTGAIGAPPSRIGVRRRPARAVDRCPTVQLREVVIERAILLHQHDDVVDRDLVAVRDPRGQGLLGQGAGAEPAVGRQLGRRDGSDHQRGEHGGQTHRARLRGRPLPRQARVSLDL